MRKYFNKWSLLGVAIAFLIWLAAVPSSTLAGIIQAIIPAAVPTANKQGNGSKFQLASTVAGTGATLCTDASGNATTTGCTAGGGSAGATLFSSTTQAGPSNSAAETTLIGTVTGSTTIAANTFTDGAVLEVVTEGYYSLPVAPSSLTLNLKCGSTVLATGSATAISTITNGSFRMWLAVTAIGSGAGGAFMTNGLVQFSGGSFAPPQIKLLNTSNVAFDFTTACVMDVTAQWGAAQVGQSITGTNVAAWIPGAPVTSVGGLTGAVPGQGNGLKVQMAGTVTGTAAPLCTDANGNTTTTGCPGVLTAPISGNWTAFNTTGMVLAPTFGSGRFTMASNATAGQNVQGIATTLPSPPYTAQFRIWPLIGWNLGTPGAQNPTAQVGWADGAVGTPGKLLVAGPIFIPGGVALIATNFTNTTTTSGNVALATIFQKFPFTISGAPIWIQLQDNNTNWLVNVSYDGVNFINLMTETRNTFLTATQLVVQVNSGASNVSQAIIFDSYATF